MKMRKNFPNEYDFFPQTWLLPAEMGDFRSQFVKGNIFSKIPRRHRHNSALRGLKVH